MSDDVLARRCDAMGGRAGEAVDRYWSRVREAGGTVIDLDEGAAGRVAELAPSLDALVLTAASTSTWRARRRAP
jgi:hypothetical protein